jgi:Domain of unknown function (DUF932)
MKMDTYTAAREWAKRPDDERFLSLQEVETAAMDDRRNCGRKTKRTSELTIQADSGALMLSAGARPADFTPWSFGQFCGVVGAPARYLSGLPAHLAADCLNHGLARLDADTRRHEHQILIRQYPDDPGRLTLRAITSPQYARVWDAPLISAIRHFVEGGPNGSGRTWQTPPSWPGKKKPGGIYRSDRDLFILQVDGGSIVNNPNAGGGAMYRGFIARNSETGSASIEIVTFLFDTICGNHLIGGITNVQQYKRRHVGSGLDYLADDALRFVAKWIDTPASRDEAIIRQLAAQEIGQSKDDVIAELRGRHGLTETQATESYTLAEQYADNPRSVWGLVNGITRYSQAGENLHNDARLSVDRLAAQLLHKFSRPLVAA